MDHQPSFAAQKIAKERELGRRLSKPEEAQLRLDTPAVASPKAVHERTSSTYGGRNTKERQEEDSLDRDKAAKRDRAAFDRGLAERDSQKSKD